MSKRGAYLFGTLIRCLRELFDGARVLWPLAALLCGSGEGVKDFGFGNYAGRHTGLSG